MSEVVKNGLDPSVLEFARMMQEEWDRTDLDWKPPVDGDYEAAFMGIEAKVLMDNQSKRKVLAVWPKYRMMGGQFDGQEFRGDRYTNKSPESQDILRRFLKRLLGPEYDPMVENSLQLAASKAGLLVCTLSVKHPEDSEYVNVRLTKVSG